MPEPKIKAVRLTTPQVELLTDIIDKPMYIRRYSRASGTAQALVERGLARRTPGYSGGSQYEITITEAGRAEANRRGLVASAP